MNKRDLKAISTLLESMDRAALRRETPNEAEWTDEQRQAIGDHQRALVVALDRQHPRAGFVLPVGISHGKDDEGEDLPPVFPVSREFRCEAGWLVVCGLLTPLGSEVARAFAEAA